eukprot:gene5916-6847_t
MPRFSEVQTFQPSLLGFQSFHTLCRLVGHTPTGYKYHYNIKSKGMKFGFFNGFKCDYDMRLQGVLSTTEFFVIMDTLNHLASGTASKIGLSLPIPIVTVVVKRHLINSKLEKLVHIVDRINQQHGKRNYGSYGYEAGSSFGAYSAIFALIGANLVVFATSRVSKAMWNTDDSLANQKWMSKNFLLNPENFRERPHTLLTAAFSHKDPSHLFFNMLSLYFIGPQLAKSIGLPLFLGLYLGGGLFASFIFCYLQQQSQKNNVFKTYSNGLGASGAVSAVMVSFACLYPNATFMFWGVIAMPAWLLVSGYIAMDAYNEYMKNQKKTGIAHSAHLGGAAFGGAYWLALLRGRF